MEKFELKSFDGYCINCYLYEGVEKPKGIVQIVHGMKEHGFRYDSFCKKLNKLGFVAFASDLRGHGKNVRKEDLGQGENLYENSVKDQIFISDYLTKKYKKLPLFIFGHSYGSFITQRYMELTNLSKKIVLSGTAFSGDASFKMGKILANIQSKFINPTKHARFIEKVGIGSYGKGFENGNWLTKDEKEWQKYNADELCGTDFPISFYKAMFNGFTKVNKHLDDIEKDTEFLLVVGELDPVSQKTKGVRKVEQKLKQNGLKVRTIVYENCRHEVHSDKERDTLLKDITEFYLEK